MAQKKKAVKKKKATKKKQTKKTQKQPQEIQKQIKTEEDFNKSELAQYCGYDAYKRAKEAQDKLRGLGMLGALMRGESRNTIRKQYHVSPNKLNSVLDGQSLDDVVAFALNDIFGMQMECLDAIRKQLANGDAKLAMEVLEKIGVFNPERRERILGGTQDGENKQEATEKRYARVFFGEFLQARQAPTEIEELVKHNIRESD